MAEIVSLEHLFALYDQAFNLYLGLANRHANCIRLGWQGLSVDQRLKLGRIEHKARERMERRYEAIMKEMRWEDDDGQT